VRVPKLPELRSEVRVDKRRRLVVAEVPVRGYFVLDEGVAVRNKFNRNMGYILDGLLKVASVTVFDEGGTGRTAQTSTGGLLYSNSASYLTGSPVFLQFGTGTATPTVTDNNLATPDLYPPTNYIDTIETDTSTQLVVAGRWAPDASKNYTEAGLKWISDTSGNYAHLLARTLFPGYLPRSAYEEYFDGYVLSFPASFTVWFVRALQSALSGTDRRQARGRLARMTTGERFVIQAPRAFAGSPDVAIGSDNTPPSPTDYNLRSPIASLGSQTQTVEVDTSLQEVRIVRSGVYTPSTTVTLGEIGLFCNLNGYVGGTLAGRRTLLVRVALSEPVTLAAGTTYSFAIVIRLA
jgi:hypothetical protein